MKYTIIVKYLKILNMIGADCMEFFELTKNEFKEYANKCPYRHIWQSTAMCELRESNHWTIYYIGVKENRKIIAASALAAYPVFNGYALFQALRGYLLNYEDDQLLQYFHKQAVAFMKQHKGIHFSMDPYVSYKQRDLHGQEVAHGFDHSHVVQTLIDLGMTHEGFNVGVDEEVSEPRWMFALPLENKTESELLKNMTQLTRRCIKKTQKAGFYLEELDREHLDEYRKLITHTSNRCGFSDRPLSYYEKMYDIFSKDDMIKYWIITLHIDEYKRSLEDECKKEEKKKQQIEDTIKKNPDNLKSVNKLSAAEEVISSLHKRMREADELLDKHGNSIVLSGAMFLLYGDEVLYLTGGSYDAFMHFCGQYRLQWEMISYAKQHDYACYNFYGIHGDFTKKDGVFEFKQGFDGEVRELIGVFHQTLHPVIYKAYQIVKRMKNHAS